MYLSKLKKLISPPQKPIFNGSELLISMTTQKIGFKLPDDYFELINLYGVGMFCDCITIYNPFIYNDSYYNLFASIQRERAAYLNWKEAEEETIELLKNYLSENPTKVSKITIPAKKNFPFNFYPDCGGLFPFGDLGDLEYNLYWNTSSNPWTIIVYDDDKYYEFEMTVSEFLYKLLTGQITELDVDNVLEDGLYFKVCDLKN